MEINEEQIIIALSEAYLQGVRDDTDRMMKAICDVGGLVEKGEQAIVEIAKGLGFK